MIFAIIDIIVLSAITIGNIDIIIVCIAILIVFRSALSKYIEYREKSGFFYVASEVDFTLLSLCFHCRRAKT